MEVLARIPEIPQAAADERGMGSPPPVPDGMKSAILPVRRSGAERPRPPVSIVALAAVAMVIWSVVAWRERQHDRAARSTIEVARQVDSRSAAGEHVR